MGKSADDQPTSRPTDIVVDDAPRWTEDEAQRNIEHLKAAGMNKEARRVKQLRKKGSKK